MKKCENCKFCDTNTTKCYNCAINLNGEPSNWQPVIMTTEITGFTPGVANTSAGIKEMKQYCENDVKALMTAMLNNCYGCPSRQKALQRIKKVIFNDPATIVFWNDGTKTVVKCGKNDTFDPEKGLAMAISKYFFDNAEYFNDVFKKWIPKKGESDGKDQ